MVPQKNCCIEFLSLQNCVEEPNVLLGKAFEFVPGKGVVGCFYVEAVIQFPQFTSKSIV